MDADEFTDSLPDDNKERELYWNRQWLNRKGHHSTAFIYSYVTTWAGAKGSRSIDASVVISDCDRQISLDLYTYGQNKQEEKAAFDNNINKLDTLIEVLTETRDAMINARNDDA